MFPGQSTKIGGRNINNFRYVDDTTIMAESKEELKSLLMRVKEKSERASLRLYIKKTKLLLLLLLSRFSRVQLCATP